MARAFAENPAADIVAGDYLVVDPQQRLLAYRRVTPLRRAMILTDHLYAFTCGLFFRRRLLDEGLWWDAELKDVADGDWVCRALARGHRAAVVREYLSAFTWTGENRSTQALAREETLRARAALPLWMRLAAPVLRQWRHAERWLAGGYTSGPIDYAVYVGEEDAERTAMRCERPKFRYPL